MDASHILVGGLTAISVALLVWIEIRSRRNAAAPERNSFSGPLNRGTTTPEKPDRARIS